MICPVFVRKDHNFYSLVSLGDPYVNKYITFQGFFQYIFKYCRFAYKCEILKKPLALRRSVCYN